MSTTVCMVLATLFFTAAQRAVGWPAVGLTFAALCAVLLAVEFREEVSPRARSQRPRHHHR